MLVKNKQISLRSQREMVKSNTEIEVVIVDVAETEIERLKKAEALLQWLFKFPFAENTIANKSSRIRDYMCGNRKGKGTWFQISKESKNIALSRIQVIADKGYQGIKNYHNNSKTPPNKPRNSQLNAEQKRENKSLAKLRIKVEHIIICLKIFGILSSRYRNRRKRFGLRVNLIAGIYNYELKIAK